MKKMTKKEIDEFSSLLLQKRHFLTGNMQDLEQGVGDIGGSGSGGDSADLGAETYEADLSLSLLESEGNVIQKIDAALGRLQEGSFGVCDMCEKPIPKARLKAIPWAPFCVDCQRKEESF
ncbi:MAG: TraR/DksA family transcriptional regulator [Planctomycetota bacterium]